MSKKVIVITGASSGIGAALAKQLGMKGYQLGLAARREKELKYVAEQTGTIALPVVTDVTSRKDVEHLRDVTLHNFGHIDVWVNNAGRGIRKTVMELTDQDLEEMINVNLKSVFYGMQTIMPHFMEREEGHLINVSSFLGRVPSLTYRSAYSAAKSAVNILTANLRMDLKTTHPRIYVSLVLAGPVLTDFHAIAGTPTTLGMHAQPFRFQSADEVASQIVSLLEHPVPELYTNPLQVEVARRYYQDVAAFEESTRRERSENM